MKVSKDDIIILLKPRGCRGYAAVVDKLTMSGCTAYLLDAEGESRPYSADEFMCTRQTVQSLTAKYARDSVQLDEALGQERSVPEFFTKPTKKTGATRTKRMKKTKGKKLTPSQIKVVKLLIKEKLKELEKIDAKEKG